MAAAIRLSQHAGTAGGKGADHWVPWWASERSRKSLPFTPVLSGNLSGEDCDEQGEDNHRRRTGARVARRDVRRRGTAAAGATGGATTAAAPNMTFFVTSVGPGKGADLGGL